MLVNQISPRVFYKSSIKTGWCWTYRIIRSVSCTANTEAIFLDGVTWYTEPHILFWHCRLGLYFLSLSWIVESVYQLSWELQRRQPDLIQHFELQEVKTSQSEVSVGEEASPYFNFCSENRKNQQRFWQLFKSPRLISLGSLLRFLPQVYLL